MLKRICILLCIVALFLQTISCTSTGTAESNGNSSGTIMIEDITNQNKPLSLSEEQLETINEMVLQNAETITESYNSGYQIPAYSLTRFLYLRMQADGVADSFEYSDDNLTIKVPKEYIWEYAKRYFNMDEVKIDFYSQQYFDGQSLTIPNPDMLSNKHSYELTLVKTEPGVSKVTVTLELRSGDVAYQRWIYTLRVGNDGILYFASMIKRPVEFGLYAINHPSAVLNELIGIPVNAQTIHGFDFVPLGNNMVVSYSNGRDLILGILEMDTHKSNSYITVTGNQKENNIFHVTVVDKNICVFQTDHMTIFNESLEEVMQYQYPQSFLDRCDQYTNQFALSPDLKYLAFTNIDGLYYLNLQTDNITSDPIRTHPKKGEEMWYPVCFDEKSGLLLARLSNAQQINNFGLFDTEKGLISTIPISLDDESLYTLRSGKLSVFAPTPTNLADFDHDFDLESTCIEYGLDTGVLRAFQTPYVLFDEYGEKSNQERVLLGNNFIYRTEGIDIGDNLVTSLSIQAFDKRTEKTSTLDFGYVDRKASLKICAANEMDKIVVACNGMFINSFVIL